MVGIAPRDMPDVAGGGRIYNQHGFYVLLCLGQLPSLFGEDGTNGKRISGIPALTATDKIKVRYYEGIFTVALNDGDPVVAEFSSPIPAGQYVPAITFDQSGTSMRSLQISGTGIGDLCPSAIAICVCSLAQKYMTQGIYLQAIEELKEHIKSSAHHGDIEAFQDILSSSAAENLLTIVIAAVNAAKEFPKLREAYVAGTLRDDVAKLLQAVWPASGDAVTSRMDAKWW
jgi:hypothetical protein